MNDFARAQYRSLFCDQTGRVVKPVNQSRIFSALYKKYPGREKEVRTLMKRLTQEICVDICKESPLNADGSFKSLQAVDLKLAKMGPEFGQDKRTKIISEIQTQNMKTNQNVKARQSQGQALAGATNTKTANTQNPLACSQATVLQHWISQLYPEMGFNDSGFIGWKKFQALLLQLDPDNEVAIKDVLAWLRKPNHANSLQQPEELLAEKRAKKKLGKQAPGTQGGGVQLPQSQFTFQLPARSLPGSTKLAGNSSSVGIPQVEPAVPSFSSGVSLRAPPPQSSSAERFDILSWKLKHLQSTEHDLSATGCVSESSCDSALRAFPKDHDESASFEYFERFKRLRSEKSRSKDSEGDQESNSHEIRNAPLLSGHTLMSHPSKLLPQYGFIGTREDRDMGLSDCNLFLNTNVPFSAFVCGVQGSGKSHTAACLLENALIASPDLGRLESPVSALVFSYGDFSNGGVGYSISEAAFLAVGNPSHPDHRVKKVTVLISPSNLAIRRYYERIPNVKVVPFRLKSQNLDIGAMLTLMAVSEKEEVPLYMAQVENVLRAMASNSANGLFSYVEFKRRLRLCNFNPTQTAMLQMRLSLLESFLDLTGKAPEPSFEPGEVTIMDLSDPFVTPNTACVMFKLGLQQFLNSKSVGKMVLLDEAHKYMLNTPGSKALNEYLLTIIRLQRHFGARVVISTQEPTLLTDLIALCSITIVHRFTSPQWFNALKKHIPVGSSSDEDIMRRIESLTTGTGLVFSSNAVLGMNADGSLIKGIGQLMKIHIRKRVTMDGGQSVTSV